MRKKLLFIGMIEARMWAVGYSKLDRDSEGTRGDPYFPVVILCFPSFLSCLFAIEQKVFFPFLCITSSSHIMGYYLTMLSLIHFPFLRRSVIFLVLNTVRLFVAYCLAGYHSVLPNSSFHYHAPPFCVQK